MSISLRALTRAIPGHHAHCRHAHGADPAAAPLEALDARLGLAPVPMPELPAGLPAGLEVDRAAVEAAMDAAYAPSTLHVYACAWRQWERWCTAREITAMPAPPGAVCGYLTERAATGIGFGTIELACLAIRHRRLSTGHPDPTRDRAVQHRLRPNELWVTDITQHRRREGWLYCCAVLDAYSRRIVGCSIRIATRRHPGRERPRHAIRNGRPEPGGIVHADHGTQFTSWVLRREYPLGQPAPSSGTAGDGLNNAMMESFWSSMQVELLNRSRWKTPVELANAIFDYIEIFPNRQRRRSALGYRTRPSKNYSPTTTPSSQPVSHRDWNPSDGPGQDVTYPCSRPVLVDSNFAAI